MEEKSENEKSNIEIKKTFSKLIEEEIPEMDQEEAIKNYREDDTIRRPKKNVTEDDGENTEESEHLKRIKKELLESLERVKQLAKKIYGEESNKSKLKANPKSAGKQKSRKLESNEKVANKEEEEKER